MTVSLVSDYAIGDANLNNLMNSTDAQRKSVHDVSLTEWDTTTEPEVAAGSVFNNNGALYQVNTDTSISGSPTGKTYIIFDPDALTFSFTNTDPTWADDKQGFYGTAGTENHRYLLFAMDVDGSTYDNKRFFPNRTDGNDILQEKVVDIGDWDMYAAVSGSLSVSIAHGLTTSDIRSISSFIRNDFGVVIKNIIKPSTDMLAFDGGDQVNADNIDLFIRSGGGFDHPDYDSTSYNRGWITIKYKN